MGRHGKDGTGMDSVAALNRKPIPLRAVRRVETRRGIQTLAGLHRAIVEEIVQNQRQIEEIARREAVVALKLEASWDHFGGFLQHQEDQLHLYQARLLQVLEELAELRWRQDRAAEICRRRLHKARGAYRGLIRQHQEREGVSEEIREAINVEADDRLEALDKMKAPRRSRNAELFKMLEATKAAIEVHGETYPLARLDLAALPSCLYWIRRASKSSCRT